MRDVEGGAGGEIRSLRGRTRTKWMGIRGHLVIFSSRTWIFLWRNLFWFLARNFSDANYQEIARSGSNKARFHSFVASLIANFLFPELKICLQLLSPN